MGPDAAAQLRGQTSGKIYAVALHRHVDVDVGLLEQQIADETPHQIHPGEVLRQS